ncbi:MAG: penicillin acylase family protein [Desulfamplus sp.]|nr:penicillin acylase family protein [Desulfamplus sp.]
MSVDCAQYGDTSFEFSLVPYKNSSEDESSELLWKLDFFSLFNADQVCDSSVAIDSDLTLAVDCANYYGTYFKFKLLPYYNASDNNSDLLWRLDIHSVELLNLPVTTSRDEKGVWFISGDDKSDIYSVFEAVGYAVATDRLWQAEKYRRMGRGRLAEIFGKSQLASDIKVRTTGYSDEEYEQGFNALDPESQAVINGYVAGFNRRIAEIKNDLSQLPFEFKALGATLGIDFLPEDWTPTDVLAWATNMLRFFDGEATGQGQINNLALFQVLRAKFPDDYMAMFEDLRWQDDPDATTYIEGSAKTDTAFNQKVKIPEAVSQRLLSGKLALSDNSSSSGRLAKSSLPGTLDMFDLTCDFKEVADQIAKNNEEIIANLKEINAYVKMGSYAWVVSGDKTASGNPILYSGPQMDHAFDFSVPSIVTEGSIKAAGLNISGMTIPGMPAIVIGRTPHHSWSMQVGHAHTLDYYLEDPSAMTLNRTETIKVAGGEDVKLPVYRTSHGPVINADPVIAWKYSHWGKEFEIVKTYLDLARATSMDQFGDAIDRVSLSQHYCYADRDGNIAYWMSGFDPVRAEGIDSRFPQPGDGTAEWSEPVVYRSRSHERNGARGFYSGWNSRSSKEYLNSSNNPSYYFGPFHRGHILEDYLSTHDNLTFEDVRDLALYISTTDSIRNEYLSSKFDTYGDGGNPWKYVKDDFIAAVQADSTEARSAALELLDGWDGHFVSGGKNNWADSNDRSDAWILMNQWISEVIKLTFEDELGKSESRLTLFNMLLHGLPGYDASIKTLYNWYQNKSDASAPQTIESIIVTGLDKALAALGEQPWGTAKRGEISYTHEMLGPLHKIPTSSRSTYAHCVEMGHSGPVRIESMLPLGESGTILMGADGSPVFDPNYFSMSEVYDGFEHRNFPLNN